MTKAAHLQIVEQVLDAIADQRLPAGTKLGEQALSDLFDCNRALVRQALAQLTAYQVVEHLPNRGAYVATPTPQDAQDVFQARRAIERTICRNAVRLADADDLADLTAHLQREAAAHGHEDRSAAVRLSRQFHLLLARVGRNAVLARYLEELVMRSSLIIGLYAVAAGTLCAEDDHHRIVEAIAARDEAAALEVLDAHLRAIEKGIDFNRRPKSQGPLSALLPVAGS